MGGEAVVKTTNPTELIADRYLVQEKLGQGGMAVVYQVFDTSAQKKVALKKLLTNDKSAKQGHIVELFEQEYYTLAQLAHPRVVEVYDFGIAGQEAYYTMELLDGGDLRELSPLPWQTVCSLMCDISSVLSLLHSRRFVHRDLTPRNVRCTQDSQAKLIDFGAMAPMGACKQIVGTPAFTAPEVVAMQSMDAQTDIFSLGATLYYALTGQLPYPARTFKDLRMSWRTTPRPPSNFVKAIPRKLDELVLSLIDLDPVARPVNASDVLERLSAIASLKVDETLLVSQAYLSKPMLVGRDENVYEIRKKVVKALRGSGSTVVVESATGTGRTRLLDACVLEGKLAGAIVLRADVDDAQSGDWGCVKSLTTQLVNAVPELALETVRPFLPVLGHILPELLQRVEREQDASFRKHHCRIVLEQFNDLRELRPRLQQALRDWLYKINEQRCLLITIDDFHRIDEPSGAFIAVFANQISDRMAFVVATTDIDAPPNSATRLLNSTASNMKLRNLSSEDTIQLLISVFGEVPQIQLLSNKIYKVTRGNPSAVMQLAQHLVDKNLIRYQGGSWILPSQIDVSDLPGSFTEALKVKLEKLSDGARQLVQTFSLSSTQRFSIEECSLLIGPKKKPHLVEILNELRAFGIVSTDGHNYSLSQPAWIASIQRGIDANTRAKLHLNLAEVFSGRGDQVCRVAKHLFAAGREESGLNALVSEIPTIKKTIETSAQAYFEYVMLLPQDWCAIFERALQICKQLERPKKESYYLQVMMARIGDQLGIGNSAPIIATVEQLIDDTGLKIYDELGDSVEPEKRLWRALELVQQKYDTSSEQERVLSPSEAISDLARTLGNAVGIASTSYDYDLLDAMPSMDPLLPLSPALGIITNSVRSMQYANSGHLELARQGFHKSLLRIWEPDRAGLDETIHKVTDLGHRWGMGIFEASFGIRTALKWADSIEKHPLHQVNAWRIRMVYYLRQGDIAKAEECKQKMELLQIQNSPAQFYEGVYQYAELTVYMITDDLIRVKRIIPGMEAMAKRFETWVPMWHLALGEYQRIRGDHKRALLEYEKALKSQTPGRHIAWPRAIGATLRSLYELTELREAKVFGEHNLRIAEDIGLEFSADIIRIPLALVQASLGEYESAIHNCQVAIDTYLNLAATGINPGFAYEARAHIAILMNDEQGFQTYAKLCAEQYKKGNYPALVAKYEKLMQRAQVARLGVSEQLARAAGELGEKIQSQYESMVSNMFTGCSGRGQRTQRALQLLVKQSESSGGYLYTIQKNGPTLCAQYGDYSPPMEMDSLVQDYIRAETDDNGDITMTAADLKEPTKTQLTWPVRSDHKYYPLLIWHNIKEGYAITGVAVLCIHQDKKLNVPSEVVNAISKSLYDAGDAVTMLAA